MSSHDDVNKPKHYDLFPNQQVIDVIEAYLTEEEFAGYCKGNALKYRLRAGDKGDALKCIAKANWHQNKLREIKETSAEAEWPDESRIDVIGQNGNDGAVYSEYTLDEVVGDAVLSDWARWVAVDKNGLVHEYSHAVLTNCRVWQRNRNESKPYDFKFREINKVVPPLNFKNCIWEIKK